MIKQFLYLVASMLFLFCNLIYAAHPLITDDTGTQGKNKFQIEFNNEFSNDKSTDGGVTAKESISEQVIAISYGLKDNLDIVIGLPYQFVNIKENGSKILNKGGLSDISIESKWRFHNMDTLSFAIKPGLSLPTGDEEKGFGNGKISGYLAFIATKEMEQIQLHFNIYYMHNEFELKEDKDVNNKDLWHLSLASQVEIIKKLSGVMNVGIEKNSDKTKDTHPAFILGGVIYSISENLDIDFGYKSGLNKEEVDSSYLAGLAMRF
ncbi:transporter [Candidatus Desantisbacteria bacterium]|nr:transporter [Candidatus Desantisbacteria bacterium]